MKNKIPQITYSNVKYVTYFVANPDKTKAISYCSADLEGDKKTLKILENVGRKVITKEEYVLAGFNHIVANAKNNKFELNVLRKK